MKKKKEKKKGSSKSNEIKQKIGVKKEIKLK